jgi:hypothetical protein
MKFSPDRPYSDPEKAARKIVEIANAVEAVQDGRQINAPFLFRERATRMVVNPPALLPADGLLFISAPFRSHTGDQLLPDRPRRGRR